MTKNIFEQGLDKRPANYQPLSPLNLLAWAEEAYADKTAMIHGDDHFTYRQFGARCRRLASALEARGIGQGDTVSIMAPNVPALLEAHYGVPMTGAVLNALTIRLDARTIALILDHAETKILIADRCFSDVVAEALVQAKRPIEVIDIDDPLDQSGDLLGSLTYEALLQSGNPNRPISLPDDEWRAISLCYTSGTTGNPKGAVYHHRGAYLNALGNALVLGLDPRSVYLWTLPMFHCNGWTYTWGVTAVGGTHVCLRKLEPAAVFRAIAEHRVSHLCGAPIVLSMLIHSDPNERAEWSHAVRMATGGAAPPSAVIEAMEEMGFEIVHLYGLTETYGPATVAAWQPRWQEMAMTERASEMARQGVRYPTMAEMQVADPATAAPVAKNGLEMGEIMLRGNTVMRGYLKNPEATEAAFSGEWYRTGDLAVWHGDGYAEVKDRSKDVIISGGENISSLEVEEALYRHPAVIEAAVVARPDARWGETPCAFVTLKPAAGNTTADEIIAFCRERLAHFKAPKTVIFGSLPKTATGKIQKFLLREQARKL
ncbi:MAG: acyl-CoA synthetase [Geminicoccaceae bacterium]